MVLVDGQSAVIGIAHVDAEVEEGAGGDDEIVATYRRPLLRVTRVTRHENVLVSYCLRAFNILNLRFSDKFTVSHKNTVLCLAPVI